MCVPSCGGRIAGGGDGEEGTVVSGSRARSWSVKAGAVILASLVWLHAVTEHQYRKVIDVPVAIADLPAGVGGKELVIANRLPSHARVLVSGTGKDILRLEGTDLLLRVRPEGGRAGARLACRLSRNQVESHTDLDLQIVEVVSPKEVEILLDERVDRPVPIEPHVALRVADHYTQVGDIRLNPDSVTLSGPRGQVEQVRAVATEVLSLPDVRGDVRQELKLVLPEGAGRLELSHSRVSIDIDIQELAQNDIAHVPVRVHGAGGQDIVTEPSRVTVSVRGGADVIYALDPETDLELYVDYDAWRRGATDRGVVQATPTRLFEIRQITPSAVTLVIR